MPEQDDSIELIHPESFPDEGKGAPRPQKEPIPSIFTPSDGGGDGGEGDLSQEDIEAFAKKHGVGLREAVAITCLISGHNFNNAMHTAGLTPLEFHSNVMSDRRLMRAFQDAIYVTGISAHFQMLELARRCIGLPQIASGDRLAIQKLGEIARISLPHILGQEAVSLKRRKAVDKMASQEKAERDSAKPKDKRPLIEASGRRVEEIRRTMPDITFKLPKRDES